MALAVPRTSGRRAKAGNAERSSRCPGRPEGRGADDQGVQGVQLAQDVHRIDGVAGANVYLLTGGEPVVIDTGLPGQAPRILAYLATVGVAASDLCTIVLTHHDIDHIGSATALAQAAGIPVWGPEGDAPYISGQRPRPGIKRLVPLLVRPFFGAAVPPALGRLLREGDELPGGFRVLATPGHTPGHISLYRPGTLVAGDLLMVEQRPGGGLRLRASPPAMSWDGAAVGRSLRRVASLPVDMILAGHGPPVPTGGGALLHDLLDRLPVR
jgi:glyoxylase-like metal-dependent hydrolase (beta-lactamase superfamily II)